MDKKLEELARNFLVKEAIKVRKGKNDRLWDAIYKAHRDTMTGARTGNLKYYRKANRDGANKTLTMLYDAILARMEQKEPLYSQPLIDAILAKDPQLEFGAAQKLVNMTLKYIIILQTFEPKNDLGVTVCEEKCDCPIDSIIISKLSEHKDVTWTTMDRTTYKKVQDEIRGRLDKDGYENKGKIWFDFLMWNAD